MDSKLFTVAKLELKYTSAVRPALRPECCTSEMAYNLLMQHWDLERMEIQEEFKVLFLDRQNRCLGIYEASAGGTTGTVADIKLIYAAALLSRAEALVLAHNHPSGHVSPSAADVRLTTRLVEAGRLLTLHVQDHLIITRFGGYYSFADHGLIEHR
jgi:DNA repair protein RadC